MEGRVELDSSTSSGIRSFGSHRRDLPGVQIFKPRSSSSQANCKVFLMFTSVTDRVLKPGRMARHSSQFLLGNPRWKATQTSPNEPNLIQSSIFFPCQILHTTPHQRSIKTSSWNMLKTIDHTHPNQRPLTLEMPPQNLSHTALFQSSSPGSRSGRPSKSLDSAAGGSSTRGRSRFGSSTYSVKCWR